jgi:type I restriction enzyme S subunit
MSLNNLPVEWSVQKFEKVVYKIVGGGTPSKSNPEYYQGNIPWMSVKDMNKNILEDTVDHITQDAIDNSATNLIPKGTPIIATRMSLGKVVVAKFDSAINQDLKAIFFGKYIDNNFFVYWYRSLAKLIESLGTGTTVKGIRLEVINNFDFPVVPLVEQQEIVRQLDVMLAQVEQIKARLDAIPAILKKFRQSVLADAVSGKLIEQNFSNLEFLKLESLILDFDNGISKRKGDSGSEVTVLRLADFKDAQRIFGNERSILLTEKELQKYKLLQNDILVVRVNGSVDIAGKFILHKVNQNDETYCDHFIRLRIDLQKLLPEYLLYIANEGIGRDYLVNSLSTSAGQNTINQNSIKGLQLRIPEIRYQRVIVQTVEKLFKYSLKIEETVQSAQKRVNLLTQSILAKAFSGELTAEWRMQHQDLITGVNSAEALLAKID